MHRTPRQSFSASRSTDTTGTSGRSETHPWHALPADETLGVLESDAAGLTSSAAAERLAACGRNELPSQQLPGIARIAMRQLGDPVVWMLLVGAVVSLGFRRFGDALFIAVVVFIDVAIATVQEHSAQRSANALRELTNFVALVRRDGQTQRVDAAVLVPGDIVVMQEGQRVPADLRLLESSEVTVDESMLTGESQTASKEADVRVKPETAVADRTNMLYAGTFMRHGRGAGLVVSTGVATELGKIAQLVLRPRPAQTPLLRRMREVARRTSLVALALVGVVVVLGLARGLPVADIALAAVALAVSAIPEGLPVALTIALALSMRRMSRRNVIARRLASVEALGACTAIASDKTGTLTINELTVEEVWLPAHDQPTPLIDIDLPGGDPDSELLTALARGGIYCNDASLTLVDGQWRGSGDSVDVALLMFAARLGMDPQTVRLEGHETWIHPFDARARFAAVAWHGKLSSAIYAKGAPERILAMCSKIKTPHGSNDIDRAGLVKQVEQLARRGYRVLALAEAPLTGSIPDELDNMLLLGLVAMIDPLRPNAIESVVNCHNAGVRVAMVTGDHPETARAIAHQLGLPSTPIDVCTGDQLTAAEERSTNDLDALVSRVHVFSRMDPAQKVTIVDSLRRLGHVVAVTGDGVNDAPALNAADVGVAMGGRGTDVARDAADIVLTDDNFSSIVAGIEEGRIAYRNIRKVVYLLASTALAEIILFLLALTVGSPTPLLAVQILWLNLVANGIQDIGLALEPGEGDELREPPRRPSEAVFNRLMIERLFVSAGFMAVAAFSLFQVVLSTGATVDEARNVVLLLMVLFENVQTGLSRSETRFVLMMNPLRNPWLLAGTVASQLVHIAAMYIPPLQHILHTTPVPLRVWLLLLTVAASLSVVVEGHKWLRQRGRPHTQLVGGPGSVE